MDDLKGYLSKMVDLFMSILDEKIYSCICYISCYLRGIEINQGNIFYGKTIFRRKMHSEISIGRFCYFRSRPRYNLIGINRPCMVSTLTSDAEIIIDDNCGFSGTVIGAFISIRLGKNVRCGANTLITDSDWHLDDYRCGDSEPVKIEDNVWLGEGAKVLKGVTIGKNSVIGAGSIVTKDIPENVIAAGNPCKVIKKL